MASGDWPTSTLHLSKEKDLTCVFEGALWTVKPQYPPTSPKDWKPMSMNKEMTIFQKRTMNEAGHSHFWGSESESQVVQETHSRYTLWSSQCSSLSWWVFHSSERQIEIVNCGYCIVLREASLGLVCTLPWSMTFSSQHRMEHMVLAKPLGEIFALKLCWERRSRTCPLTISDAVIELSFVPCCSVAPVQPSVCPLK